jgi:NAD-dependent SIR2 family protein deacetylase
MAEEDSHPGQDLRDDDVAPSVEADDFARRLSMRAPNVMWFLGAGVSAAAGIPTAGDMIWEFKQRLFVSQRRVSPELVADLAAPGVRQRLQEHIDSMTTPPKAGDPGEYSALFKAVFPSEVDRRTYLDSKMTGAKPSYGHLALAVLMHGGQARLVWTTNFDPLVADACAKAFDGTGALTTVALNAPEVAAHAISEGRWPVEIKLHGDFRHRELKNTDDELRHQDEQLRQVLVDSCGRFGMVVAGYSGRDESVMKAFEAAVEKKGAFPSGLFWLHRGEDAPFERVTQLLVKAKACGVEAALVRVENFDEAMRDIIRLIKNLDTKVLDEFGKQRARWSAAPLLVGKGGWPLIRLNALRFAQMPSVCRRVVCDIGGYADVRAAAEKAGVDLLFARSRRGVLLFGSDADARAAFGANNITEFDLAAIEPRKLRYESADRGLLKEAVSRAVARHRGLTLLRKRTMDLLYPTMPSAEVFADLRRAVGSLTGTLSGFPDLHWHEGVGLRLEWAADKLWLLLEPTTVFTGVSDGTKAVAADFARERTVKRYNQKLDALIDFWAAYLVGDGEPLHALDVSGGVDAVFQLAPRTGFSKRATA